MKRILASFLIVCIGLVGVDVHFNESRASLRAVASVSQSLDNQTFANPTFTGTVTASQVTGMERVLAQWGVPCILASSGTMGNNGAVSGMTALPTTYSGGAWLYLPANAIDGSSAAGFYWFVASSTTAGTVYNSTWNGAGIPTAGTTTAFSTTGPGAFTGIATGEITAATVTVPAGAMGPNGRLFGDVATANNTAAGNKTFRVKFGATTIGTAITASSTNTTNILSVRNLGVATQQVADTAFTSSGASTAGSVVYPAENTANAVNLVFTLEKATAANHAILHGGNVRIAYGS